MADINANLKTALNGIPAQHKDANSAGFEVTEGSDGQLHVRDHDAKTELGYVRAELVNVLSVLQGDLSVHDTDVLTTLQEISVKLDNLTSEPPTIYGLSTETKPTTDLIKGTSFFEIDNKALYMWDGESWRLM